MAQFSLPQNSKIEVGNYFKDKTKKTDKLKKKSSDKKLNQEK